MATATEKASKGFKSRVSAHVSKHHMTKKMEDFPADQTFDKHVVELPGQEGFWIVVKSKTTNQVVGYIGSRSFLTVTTNDTVMPETENAVTVVAVTADNETENLLS
jgi:hypothetical protein